MADCGAVEAFGAPAGFLAAADLVDLGLDEDGPAGRVAVVVVVDVAVLDVAVLDVAVLDAVLVVVVVVLAGAGVCDVGGAGLAF